MEPITGFWVAFMIWTAPAGQPDQFGQPPTYTMTDMRQFPGITSHSTRKECEEYPPLVGLPNTVCINMGLRFFAPNREYKEGTGHE